MTPLTVRRGMASLRVATVPLCVAALLLSPLPVAAQSAADKATARQLALEGVQQYQAEKWAESLDRMQRAQALYDAPVHLLYIARAQVKLGRLVEGAETYRRLARTVLPADAPEAFKDAVATGQRELPEVEARIPRLRIDVEPTDAEGLEVKLGDTVVPIAALGVNRPTNPGSHVARASAPGYTSAQADVTLAEGATESIRLRLERSAQAGTGLAEGGEGTGKADPSTAGEEPYSKLGFVLGLRLGGVVPGGTGFRVDPSGQIPPRNREVPLNELYGGGAGLELRGGLRFAKYFTGHLIAAGYGLQPGPDFDRPVAGVTGSSDTTSTSTLVQLGLGGTVGSAPGKFGLFGELDLMLVHSFETERKVQAEGKECTEKWTADGTSVRLAGGLNVPLSEIFQLTPMLGVSVGRFRELSLAGCDELGRGNHGSALGREYAAIDDILSGQRLGNVDYPAHGVFFMGIGVDWLIGGK